MKVITKHDVMEIFKEHPLLNTSGYDIDNLKLSDGSVSTWKTRQNLLLDMMDKINECAKWIDENIRPVKTKNVRRTAYGIKHITEREIGYIPQGVFIVAAIERGYKCSVSADTAVFNMSEKSIRIAEKRINSVG